MDNFVNQTNHRSGKKSNIEKKTLHHNSKNILSILFDEANLSEEKFDAVKKELHLKHHFHLMLNKGSSNDVFNQYT